MKRAQKKKLGWVVSGWCVYKAHFSFIIRVTRF